MDTRENNPTAKIIAFLEEIGIKVIRTEIHEETFLPGIKAEEAKLLIDESRMLYPGDMLHEAGHLAVIPPERREKAKGNMGKDRGEEMMAIAWSYAAMIHLELEPEIVFHEDGYRGGSKSILENFSQGRYFGVPVLQWLGLTIEPRHAKENGEKPFPHMIKWLVD